MGTLKNKTCCFTGHREIPFYRRPLIYQRVKKEVGNLIQKGYLYFGSGGARGFDTIAALIIIRLKRIYPQIRLILVLPCAEQTKGWDKKDLKKYDYIIKNSDKIVYISDNYTKDCMHKRNRHLVDNSSVCICYLNKNHGGTFYTVNYAQKMNIEIIPIIKHQRQNLF